MAVGQSRTKIVRIARQRNARYEAGAVVLGLSSAAELHTAGSAMRKRTVEEEPEIGELDLNPVIAIPTALAIVYARVRARRVPR